MKINNMLRSCIVCFCTIILIASYAQNKSETSRFFAADNSLIQYVGRIDFSDKKLPRYWQPGVYVKARFTGTFCNVIINDEMLWGKNHNYLEVVIDDTVLYRLQTKGKRDTIRVAEGLSNGTHTILIAKNTEANIGYIEFVGLQCKQLLPLPAKPQRRMEFIGNSITCGASADESEIPCGTGVWQDQHNAYLAYGPTAARNLNAQWILSSVSGIGLVHSCCNMDVVMPQVFDNINMRNKTDSLKWNFTNYQPDVVTVCLGQNDGIQDSSLFCSAYVQFLQRLRGDYPKAKLVCLTSPMADSSLAVSEKKYLGSIVSFTNESGDKNVSYFFFSKRYDHGCDSHPNVSEHKQIAAELSAYVKKLMSW